MATRKDDERPSDIEEAKRLLRYVEQDQLRRASEFRLYVKAFLSAVPSVFIATSLINRGVSSWVYALSILVSFSVAYEWVEWLDRWLWHRERPTLKVGEKLTALSALSMTVAFAWVTVAIEGRVGPDCTGSLTRIDGASCPTRWTDFAFLVVPIATLGLSAWLARWLFRAYHAVLTRYHGVKTPINVWTDDHRGLLRLLTLAIRVPSLAWLAYQAWSVITS